MIITDFLLHSRLQKRYICISDKSKPVSKALNNKKLQSARNIQEYKSFANEGARTIFPKPDWTLLWKLLRWNAALRQHEKSWANSFMSVKEETNVQKSNVPTCYPNCAGYINNCNQVSWCWNAKRKMTDWRSSGCSDWDVPFSWFVQPCPSTDYTWELWKIKRAILAFFLPSVWTTM